MDTSIVRADAPKLAKKLEGYTSPIARTGEQQFACILRNRSGESSGEIDFGARFINDLSEGDQQAAIESVYSVYLKWRSETGKKSHRDHIVIKHTNEQDALVSALRQYRHNDRDGFVFGYDIAETERILSEQLGNLVRALERFLDNPTPRSEDFDAARSAILAVHNQHRGDV